jgi:uncharacterized protein YbcI
LFDLPSPIGGKCISVESSDGFERPVGGSDGQLVARSVDLAGQNYKQLLVPPATIVTIRVSSLEGRCSSPGSASAALVQFGPAARRRGGVVKQWRGESEAIMRTQGELEAAISEGVARFEQQYMGRGPKDIRSHLIGDLVVIRLRGVLTVAEQQLVRALPAEKGRDLLKQVRTHLIETARPAMEELVTSITGMKVLSLHHDISTTTGEEVVLFTLSDAPVVRERKD